MPSHGAIPVAPVTRTTQAEITARQEAPAAGWPFSTGDRVEADFNARFAPRAGATPAAAPSGYPGQAQAAQRSTDVPRASLPASMRGGSYASRTVGDSGRGRRMQDDQGYRLPMSYSDSNRQASPQGPRITPPATQRTQHGSDPTAPAWLYAPQTPAPQAPITQAPAALRPSGSGQSSSTTVVPQSSVADTLQHSRERVAARWYALKGVFEQPGQEQQETPVRQKEIRTPVLAVFSLAGAWGRRAWWRHWGGHSRRWARRFC